MSSRMASLDLLGADDAPVLVGLEVGDVEALLLEVLRTRPAQPCAPPALVMKCLPFAPVHVEPRPLSARLIASVEPDVKTISFALAPISEAICSRDLSTASSAFQPYAWLRLAALPNASVK